jgi:hypothetical protein
MSPYQGNGYYKQYMELCHEMNDQIGVGVASNCIGSDFIHYFIIVSFEWLT